MFDSPPGGESIQNQKSQIATLFIISLSDPGLKNLIRICLNGLNNLTVLTKIIIYSGVCIRGKKYFDKKINNSD